MKEEAKSVKIGWEVYTIDSSNEWLLKEMEGWKKFNDQTNKWEDSTYKYLPMNMVYRLMDGLFESYNLNSWDATWTGETYSVEKYDYKTKKTTTEEVRSYRKTVSITVFDFDWRSRTVVWYAEWVAWTSILSKDNARNGFMRKLAARARKEALANLWQVFRVDEWYLEDEIEAIGIREESKQTWVVIEKGTQKAEDSIKSIKDKLLMDYMSQLGEMFKNLEDIKNKDMLLVAMKKIKADNKIVDGSIEHEVIKNMYNSILTEYKLQ